MAFKEVSAPPVELDEVAYQKFSAVGDTMTGVFMSCAESKGKYGGTDYKFNTKEKGVVIFTANYRVEKHLAAANLQPGMRVHIARKPDVITNSGKAIWDYKILIDDVITDDLKKYAKGEPIPGGPPKPAPAAAPAADPFGSDVPF